MDGLFQTMVLNTPCKRKQQNSAAETQFERLSKHCGKGFCRAVAGKITGVPWKFTGGHRKNRALPPVLGVLIGAHMLGLHTLGAQAFGAPRKAPKST